MPIALFRIPSQGLQDVIRFVRNSTVTYTTPISDPTTVVNWTVNGADDFTTNGNNVTVQWGDAGVGEVAVSVGSSSSPFTIACAQAAPYVDPNNNNPGLIALYIYGNDVPYTVIIDGDDNGFYGGGSYLFGSFDPGIHTIEVIDPCGERTGL